MTYEKPLPHPNADDKTFWEGCREHKLLFQKCRSCGLIRWPSSAICPGCYSGDMAWTTSTGKGKVFTFAVYHRAFHPAFESDLPYVTAVVELEEGPHFLTNIVGCRPDDVRCDMPVEVTWEDITEEYSLPKFKPAS